MATLLDSYSEANQDTGIQLFAANATAGGQSFTTPNDGISYTLASCKWYLKKIGSPTGNAVAKLYAHTGTYGTSSLPTGAALATSDNLDVTTLGTSYALTTLNFSTPYTLSPNTHYVITYEHSGADASNQTVAGADSSSPSAAGNFMYLAGTWQALNAWDGCFYVYGNTPSSGPANLKTINGMSIR